MINSIKGLVPKNVRLAKIPWVWTIFSLIKCTLFILVRNSFWISTEIEKKHRKYSKPFACWRRNRSICGATRRWSCRYWIGGAPIELAGWSTSPVCRPGNRIWKWRRERKAGMRSRSLLVGSRRSPQTPASSWTADRSRRASQSKSRRRRRLFWRCAGAWLTYSFIKAYSLIPRSACWH